ncbi:von Willebrand factor A domain-containing protein 7-like isoform X2 [Glandiceps talaboti]
MASPFNKFHVFQLVVILTLCIIKMEAFYSITSKATNSDPKSDYTHRTMTHEALLKVVARFLEDKLRPGSSISPGDLQNLDPLTSTSLARAYYGAGQMSSIPLEKAMNDIISGNTDVDFYEWGDAASHFNAEQFDKANERLQDTRDALIQLLQESDPDYQTARYLAGEYLHIAQDFYSNTNWVEMKGGIAYEDLGLKDVKIIDYAERNVYTCESCDDSIQGSCDRTLIVKGETLTSGYKSSHGVRKPTGKNREGKCSHGGKDDESRNIVATGGINKESQDLQLSPHNTLHQDAAMAAIQATENFFLATGYGLRNQIGDATFMKFFNLREDSAKSLSIVMDVTGSMGDEIQAVKEKSFELIDERVGTVNEPANYVLVPFSDPEYGPVYVTTNPEEFKAAIANLIPAGGGDCPELSMIGTEQAVLNSLPGSVVYGFTDADAKDSSKADYVANLAASKGIEVTFLLTGDCGVYKRSIDQSNHGNQQDNQRQLRQRRRKRTPDIAYQTIADATGGVVLRVSKSELKEATEIITLSFRGSEVTILDVEIGDSDDGGNVKFTVDSTMSKITITATTNEETTATLFTILDPLDNVVTEGKLENQYQTVVNSADKLIILVRASNPGDWQLVFNDNRKWQVVINATSPIDFLYAFYTHDASGMMIPLHGYPAIGQDLSILIVVTGIEQISSVDTLVLNSQSGTELRRLDLSTISGNSYLAETTVPDENFGIQIQGLDGDSNAFYRTRSARVKVQTVGLQLKGGIIHYLAPTGNPVKINFKISNKGDESDNYTVAVLEENELAYSFIQDYAPKNVVVGSKSSVEGHIIAVSYENATGGTHGTVKLTVTGESGSWNVIEFELVVLENLQYYRKEPVIDGTDQETQHLLYYASLALVATTLLAGLLLLMLSRR